MLSPAESSLSMNVFQFLRGRAEIRETSAGSTAIKDQQRMFSFFQTIFITGKNAAAVHQTSGTASTFRVSCAI